MSGTAGFRLGVLMRCRAKGISVTGTALPLLRPSSSPPHRACCTTVPGYAFASDLTMNVTAPPPFLLRHQVEIPRNMWKADPERQLKWCAHR